MEGKTLERGQKAEYNSISFCLNYKHQAITFVAIIILGLITASLVHYGVKQNFSAACFITAAVLAPITFAVGSFSMYYLITNIRMQKKIKARWELPTQEKKNGKILLEKFREDPKSFCKTCENKVLNLQMAEAFSPRFFESPASNTFENTLVVSQPEVEGVVASPNEAERVKDSFLPSALITYVCGYLYISEMSKLALANNMSNNAVKNATMLRAKDYKYTGNDANEAKKYLQEFRMFMKIYVQKLSIAIHYSYPPRQCGSCASEFTLSFFDFERTFRKLEFSEEAKINFQSILDKALICCAQKKGQINPKLLLSLGANPNQLDDQGGIALHYAVTALDVELVTLLLEHGSEVNVSSKKLFTPLHRALNAWIRGGEDSAAKYEEIIVALLEGKADPNIPGFRGRPALHNAISSSLSNTEKIIKLLLQYKADINARDANGDTTLCSLLRRGGSEVIKERLSFLLTVGANPNIPTNSGETPLHLAVNRHYHVLEILLDYQANIDARDQDGDTPLYSLLRQGVLLQNDQEEEVVIRLLLRAGASLNIRTPNGDTALHLAVTQGYDHVVQTLLDYQADIDQSNNQGDTPLSLALKADEKEIAQLLLSSGADPKLLNTVEI